MPCTSLLCAPWFCVALAAARRRLSSFQELRRVAPDVHAITCSLSLSLSHTHTHCAGLAAINYNLSSVSNIHLSMFVHSFFSSPSELTCDMPLGNADTAPHPSLCPSSSLRSNDLRGEQGSHSEILHEFSPCLFFALRVVLNLLSFF